MFGHHYSMYKIRNRYNAESQHFQDLSVLGVFVDNHDNARFLHNFSNAKTAIKQAETFALTSTGIPFTYYGTEQYYAGGNDP